MLVHFWFCSRLLRLFSQTLHLDIPLSHALKWYDKTNFLSQNDHTREHAPQECREMGETRCISRNVGSIPIRKTPRRRVSGKLPSALPQPAYQWQRSRFMLWAVEDRVVAPEPSASPRESESFVMRKSRKLNPAGYDQDA